VSEETTPIPVEYSPWELDPATGMLVSIVKRTDTGEIIGKAERAPELAEDQTNE
jgi:hypothetical protein